MKIKILLSSFLLLLSLSPSWADDSDITPTPARVDAGKAERAKEFLDRGNDFEAHGYSAKAKEYWKIAFDMDPELTEAKEKWEEASGGKSVDGASPDESMRSSELLSKAQEAYDKKDYYQALKILDTVDSLTPDDPQAKRLRAKITLENFQFDPNHDDQNLVQNFFNQAVQFYRAKDYDQALKVLGKAEQLAPDQVQLKQFEAVIKDDYADIWAGKEIQRARDQLADGDKDDAIETINDVLKQQPGCKEALKLQAQMNQQAAPSKKGDGQDESDQAKETSATNSTDQAAQKSLKKAKKPKGPVDKALADLEKAYKAGDQAAAQAALDAITLVAPDFPKLAYWKQKIEGMSEKVGIDHGKADQCFNLGMASYDKGNFIDTKKFWEEALEYNPLLTQARTNLKRLLLEHPDLK